MSHVKSHGITILLAIALVGLLGALAFLWSDLAQARQESTDRKQMADTLRAELDRALSAHERMAARLQALSELPQGRAAVPGDTEEAQAPPEPEPDASPDLLALGEITVEPQTGSRLAATLHFKQTADRLHEPFILVVRIATGAYAEIVSLAPSADKAYSDSSRRVAENGKFAVFQGTPVTGEPLEMVLSLSAPGTVSIHASNGLPPFSVDIQPGGATAQSAP